MKLKIAEQQFDYAKPIDEKERGNRRNYCVSPVCDHCIYHDDSL
jgi:hypothetical protein